MATESDYLRFERDTAQERRKKTQVWLVISRRTEAELGQIRWMPHWHQYAFYPEANTVFNPVCLLDVQTTIWRLMAERRKG